jgi:hypothetical protein
MISQTVLGIFLGILFIVVFARIIRAKARNPVKALLWQIAFFGGMFGLVDGYHVYIGPAWNLPEIHPLIFIATATAIGTFAFLKVLLIIGKIFPLFAPLMFLDMLFLGTEG